ncbi:MAG: sugar ABC transporter substrate-binding protein [Pleomorphochaeta sp.]
MNKKMTITLLLLIILSTFIYISNNILFGDNDEKQYKIAFIRMKEGGQFWSSMRNGAREARTDTKTSVEFFSTISAGDINDQTEFVENAIEKKVDAIVIIPSDTKALVEPLKQAKESGIKIIQLFNEIDDEENIIDFSVMTDTKEIGIKIADKIIDNANDKKVNVLLVSRSPKVTSSKYMEESIMQKFKSTTNINCSSLYAGSSINLISERIMNYINNYQALDYIIALDDDSSEGIAQYFNQEGTKKNIYFFATSHSLSNIQNLEKDIIDELLIINGFAMGYQGVNTAYNLLSSNTIDNQKIDYNFVTKENMFDEDIQNKLFILY